MAKHSLPLFKVYGLLETGPVVLISVADLKGNANIMTQAWHTMMEFEPPLVGCVMKTSRGVMKPRHFPGRWSSRCRAKAI